MTCSLCISYVAEKKLIEDNTFLTGNKVLLKQTLKEHNKSHLHNLAENHLIDNAIQIFKNPSNLVKIDSFFKNNREKMEFDKMLPLFKAAYFVEKKI